MTTPTPTVAVFTRTRFAKPCKTCGEPITLARTTGTKAWMAFEADPVALRTRQGDDGSLVEDVALSDRHDCRGPLFTRDEPELL